MVNYSGIQMVKLVTDQWSLVALAVERVPGAVNIPMGQLRSRLSELPRDREIHVICRSAQRADYCNAHPAAERVESPESLRQHVTGDAWD
jgi:hypothetical protein